MEWMVGYLSNDSVILFCLGGPGDWTQVWHMLGKSTLIVLDSVQLLKGLQRVSCSVASSYPTMGLLVSFSQMLSVFSLQI